MSGFIKDFKTFMSIDTVIALALCSTMWLVYYFTDFKLLKEFEDSSSLAAYMNKIIIGISIFTSLGGGFYVVAKLTNSMIDTLERLMIIALCVVSGGYGLYTIGSVPKNFLQSDFSLLAIFSGIILFLLLCFGWQEPKEVSDAKALEASAVSPKVEKTA